MKDARLAVVLPLSNHHRTGRAKNIPTRCDNTTNKRRNDRRGPFPYFSLVCPSVTSDNADMPTRSRKPRQPDPNLMAIAIVEGVTGETLVEKPAPEPDTRNPAAVALGKLGGAKGGKARAAAMTKKERIAAAKKAASVRWGKKPTANANGKASGRNKKTQ